MIKYLNEPVSGKETYFLANRFFSDSNYVEFSHIPAKEIVSFDCGLFNLTEISKDEIPAVDADHQILCVIVNPEATTTCEIANDPEFEFCGYDLIEEETSISAITNCGDEFVDLFGAKNLTKFGLIPDFEAAVNFQKKLVESFPEEPHADCIILKIWRRL